MITISLEGLDRASTIFTAFSQPAINARMQKSAMAGAIALRTPIRNASPVGKTRKLRGSVRARKSRRGFGAVVGPTARHRHLVIAGTRVRKARSMSNANRGHMTANPYVERTRKANWATVEKAMAAEALRGF